MAGGVTTGCGGLVRLGVIVFKSLTTSSGMAPAVRLFSFIVAVIADATSCVPFGCVSHLAIALF